MEDLALDLDLLRAFIAVAEAGSFTAAADVVGRSQSAVSQKIRRLEQQLGLRVFERTSRSLSLTQDGQRVLVAGRRMLDQYDAFVNELRSPRPLCRLRLGISENLIHTQLPRLLGRFNQLYPDVQLELMTGTSTDLLANYEAGHLDVVIAKRKKGRSAPGRVIWREPLVWMASVDTPDGSLGPARLVTMQPPCAYRDVMIEVLNSIRREWLISCTASNLVGIQAAVIGGLGVTALGASFLQQGMRVLPVSAQWPALPLTEVAVIGDHDDTSRLVQPLVALMTEELSKTTSLVATL